MLLPRRFFSILSITAFLHVGCTDVQNEPSFPSVDTPKGIAVIEEAFLTVRDTTDNVDSPAVWHGPDGQHWLLATAKERDALLVHDAATGALLQRVGTEGVEPGQFDRPNGIAVIDDLALIVERDNARVQALRLPSFMPLGFIGQDDLRRPYGLTVVPDSTGGYLLYVTDNYEQTDDVVPPDSLLGERVRQYRFLVENDTVQATLVRTIGATTGDGILRVVESILADSEHDRLLIAEEVETASRVKVYTLDGRYTGAQLDTRYFPHQAEGLALYACADGAGYWIATDQNHAMNTFHVFDRRTLEHLGAFTGAVTRNTDGIALTRRGFGPFSQGAFYAVHDDGNVAAFSWRAIAEALELGCSPGRQRHP